MMCHLSNVLGAVDGIIYINPQLKGAFGFDRFLDLEFLFMEEIWNDVQKRSGYILSSISSHTLAVSPANNDIVDMWTNLWCKNSKEIYFLDGNFFVFPFALFIPKTHVSFVEYVAR